MHEICCSVEQKSNKKCTQHHIFNVFIKKLRQYDETSIFKSSCDRHINKSWVSGQTNNMKISIEVREKVRKYGGLTFERIKKTNESK